MKIERRDFLRTGALAALCAPAASAFASGKPEKAGSVRFCAFSDIHYFPGRFPHDNRAWLERILARAERSRCDFVIQLGDFTHNPIKQIDYVNFYNDFRIPTHHTVGNHDFDQCPYEAVYDAYRIENGYHFFDHGGFRFISVDTNNSYSNGIWRHYGDKSKPAPNFNAGGHVLNRVPPEELEWLKAAIESSPHPCVVTSHASFEREDGSPDREAVRKIFNDANARTPGKVRLVINGHYHCDHLRLLDGIVYLDLNSASNIWYGTVHKGYPVEDTRRYVYMQNMLIWKDPLSAVITLSQDGGIRIEGMKGAFYRDVTPAVAKCPASLHGRQVTPNVQSFDMKFDYAAMSV